jgi:predicted CXXCH cytochrome family protein
MAGLPRRSRNTRACLLLACAGGLSCSRQATTPVATYSDAAACAGCHQEVAKTYRKTGMGRSFYRASPERMVENFTSGNRFHHKPSERSYQMARRGDRFFLRRHQRGPDGREINVIEKEIHYVMGSGNHARSYIHRTPENRLIELPVAWYAEKGGFFAMSPGYDRAEHPDFRRNISFDCLFCHNGYPKLAPGADLPGSEPIFPGPLPEGIDCQRCHGPGGAHIAAVQARSAPEVIRASIVNPARLHPGRQIEVCMQCHLETTSFTLPNSIPRYDRGAFSYRPNEPLANFVLHFDHAPGTGREEKFEIVSSVYRLRRSACFQKSGGKLGCTTCHNPHDIPRGEQAAAHYSSVCRQCHAALETRITAGRHTSDRNCLPCHMPKRRTEDVVHAVMTDHRIPRTKRVADLVAPLAERQERESQSPYRGEVVLYHPATLPAADRDLYTAVAQVVQNSNLEAGIPRLETAIGRHRPSGPVFYFQLAQAHLAAGRRDRAIANYRRSLEQNSGFVPALRSLGSALLEEGQAEQALETLERATQAGPGDANSWHQLARARQRMGRTADALAAARRAVELEPELADAHNTLGGILVGAGDHTAEAAFREAIRQRPDYAEAHYNLAQLVASADRLAEAEAHLVRALAHAPRMAEASEMLGNLRAARGAWPEAIARYREALRAKADFPRAHLGLGAALMATGDLAGARAHLTRASSAPDPPTRQEARDLLDRLSRAR